MKLPQDNLNYPIRILIGKSSGSGFLIKHEQDIYVVTAKHVIYQPNFVKGFDLIAGEVRLVCYPRTEAGVANIPRIYKLDLSRMSDSGDLKAHISKDLVVIKFGTVHELENKKY